MIIIKEKIRSGSISDIRKQTLNATDAQSPFNFQHSDSKVHKTKNGVSLRDPV